MGKFLIIAGIILVVVGLAVEFAPKIPWLGRLPGDIYIERGNVKIYIPVVSGLVLSLLVSLVLLLINKAKQ